MILSQLTPDRRSQVEADFQKVPLDRETQSFFADPSGCTDEERFFVKYLYAYMPIGDIASYPCGLFLKNVRDTMKTCRLVPWAKQVDAERFLCDILPLRINNEDLVDCRGQFFAQLYPRVKSLSMREAALEVNYWCFEKATYRSTDDRTVSPLTAIRNAYGRCGEESVLCVAALRSVGIPARQCYTPRWAHCDDNHAWVEVWVDGGWHCMGACEPEPVLDKGWFVEVAKRGMLVHARTFSHIVSEPEITNQTSVMSQINILPHYAKTRRLEVAVTDDGGSPLENAQVRFELINFAELFPLAVISTDRDGKAHLVTGYGDLFVHVSKNGRYVHKKASRFCTNLLVSMEEAVTEERGNFDLELVPPPAEKVADLPLPSAIAARHAERLQRAIQLRHDFEASFIKADAAARFAAQFPAYQKEFAERISLSNGNHEEIRRFLEDDCGVERRYKVMLLQQLRPKDLSDITCRILQSHLKGAYPYRFQYDETLFAQSVLRPYVRYEMITPYRDSLNGFFDDATKRQFRDTPEKLYRYIRTAVTDCTDRDYGTTSATPAGLLKLRRGSALSRKIAFVAICRTLGIPARVGDIDGRPEYWKNGRWHIVSPDAAERSCRLTVINRRPDTPLAYGKDFTVARLVDGTYRTMGLEEQAFGGNSATYHLEEGKYRVLTAKRLLDGTVLARLYHVELLPGKPVAIPIELRRQESTERQKIAMPSIPLKWASSGLHDVRELIHGFPRVVLAFVQVSQEPTEHLLNEILEQSQKFAAHRAQILLLVDDAEALSNPLLKKAVDSAGIGVAVADRYRDAADSVLASLGSENRHFPLVVALEKENTCLFHISGYNVGTGERLLRALENGPG